MYQSSGSYGQCSGQGSGSYQSSGCGNYSNAQEGYSGSYSLNDVVASMSESRSAPAPVARTYDGSKGLYLWSPTEQTHAFSPEDFIIPGNIVPSVGKNKEVEEWLVQAFEKTTGTVFPENIHWGVFSDEKFDALHARHSNGSDGIVMGFSLNRGVNGVSEVFVRAASLDRVMLTLGHEIGHVMSSPLPDARDEEAKAFAFSLAWMKTIVDHNIAGLQNVINPLPAKNGLHDVAFHFVQDFLEQGEKAINVFKDIVQGVKSFSSRRYV